MSVGEEFARFCPDHTQVISFRSLRHLFVCSTTKCLTADEQSQSKRPGGGGGGGGLLLGIFGGGVSPGSPNPDLI